MDRAVARAVRFRHVVFPDSVGGYGRAVNVAPARAAPHAPPGHAGLSPGAPRPASYGPSLSPDAESFLCGVLANTGVAARHYKPESLHRRLPACLRALRATSLSHARSVLQRQPHLAWEALGALVIGVTSFFRDPAVFDALRRQVLPRLLDRRAEGRPLRVWSVGCSDGAELYSVAMLLAELGGFGGAGCELVGTDCRPAALARAAAGAFAPAAVTGLPPEILSRWFDYDGAHYHVSRSLRSAARWQVADAMRVQDAPAGPWDLVLCRNLVIYLQPAAAASLWTSLAASLRPGGVLVTGKAERPLGVRGLTVTGPCLYRKAG